MGCSACYGGGFGIDFRDSEGIEYARGPHGAPLRQCWGVLHGWLFLGGFNSFSVAILRSIEFLVDGAVYRVARLDIGGLLAGIRRRLGLRDSLLAIGFGDDRLS